MLINIPEFFRTDLGGTIVQHLIVKVPLGLHLIAQTPCGLLLF